MNVIRICSVVRSCTLYTDCHSEYSCTTDMAQHITEIHNLIY